MELTPDSQQPPVWLPIIETPVPRVLLVGVLTLLLPEPADPIVGWSTTDDGETW